MQATNPVASAELTPHQELINDMAALAADPLKFVYYAFPWGTDKLDGNPEPWQIAILCDVRDGLKTVDEVIREARASGHGIGKSALVAWLILWAMCTCADTRGVVTANTDTQLRTKTWAELSKWYSLLMRSVRLWFTLTATSIYSADPKHEKTWRIDMVPWSENNTEAFAGLHNKNKRVILIFDEASAIADKIWDVAEGALTDADTEILWFAFGNPTRNTGRFFECFTKFRHRWNGAHIDSRTVSFTNKDLIKQWEDDYGEDSDFFRVRVRGLPPKQEPDTLIPMDWLEEAKVRVVAALGPVILGVDVARFGNDDTVICVKNGRVIEPFKKEYVIHGNDTMQVAGKVKLIYREHHAVAANIDEIGVGAGVVDRLGEDKTINARGINVAEKANDEERFVNLRSEMWWAARESLDPKNPAAMKIPDDPHLIGDLLSIKWSVDSAGRIKIEPKADTKKRLGRSPDRGDAYALAVFESYLYHQRAGAAHGAVPVIPRRPKWL